MSLREIGLQVRARRDSLGLSQHRLARMAGLSRATVNQLETGALVDLGAAKLAVLLDLLGLELGAANRPTPRHGLRMAARNASVSYRTPMPAAQLAQALATGRVPPALLPHIATLLDETPLPVVVAAVAEASARTGKPPRQLWRHLARWATDLRSPRPAWA